MIFMEIIEVLKKKEYFSMAFLSATFMFLFLPFVQTLGLQTDIWYTLILELPLNLALFLVFLAVFGVFVSFQVYRIRGPKVCPVNKTGSAGGLAGTAFSFVVGVCPACVGFASLFFPVAIVSTLVAFGPVFITISILLMLLSIHLNGGFKEAKVS